MIYFSHRGGLPESHLTLNGRNIPFSNSITYLGITFDKRVKLKFHIEVIETGPSEYLLQYILPIQK
jgi:hypothetical protein